MANLDGSGLSEVWVRAAQLVKKYTGAVDSTKGDLQTQVNKKLSGTDDTKDNTVTFTSADESNPTVWKDVATLDSNEKHSSILNKISNMFSNIRYLYKNVGGIKGLSSSSAITTQGEYALDAREKNASVEGTLANQIDVLNSNFKTIAYTFIDNVFHIPLPIGKTALIIVRTTMSSIARPTDVYIASNIGDAVNSGGVGFSGKQILIQPLLNSYHASNDALNISSDTDINEVQIHVNFSVSIKVYELL